jgi:DNA-binding phage protein
MRSHEEATIHRFRNDPSFALEYLAAVLSDGDESEREQTLRRLAKAFSKDSGDM